MKKRRCLVPANAFYEWPKEGKQAKAALCFRTGERQSLCICGSLGCVERPTWSLASVLCHRDRGSQRTHGSHTPAHAGHSSYQSYDRWLDREENEQLPLDLLRPFESEDMEMYEANPKVNNSRNNGPEMLKAASAAAESGILPL